MEETMTPVERASSLAAHLSKWVWLLILAATLLPLHAAEAQAPLVSCPPAEVRATERSWFFGASGGIDFGVSGTVATPVLGGPQAQEGTTVVTDTSGQLLFWSNGITVFNRNHQPMPNGSGLLGHPSTVQTVASFPSLTRPGVYFVVATSGANELGGVGELYYSEVDMSLDGGLGDVTAVKNVQLGAIGAATEALTAVPTSDGTGFWVLAPTFGAPLINAYRFDGNGPVTGTAVVSTLSTANGSTGTLNFSADLTQLVQMTATSGTLTQMRLLTFDAASGAVSERFTWQLPNQVAYSHGYAADFSPSGDYVYAVRIWNGAQLYRYRVAGATTAAEVDATREDLGIFGPNGGQVRRGPDGRMYVASFVSPSLSIVNDPDNPVNPGFVVNGFPLAAGTASMWGLPQLVTGCPIPLDYSDAPVSYGAVIHRAEGPQLGSLRDSEPAAIPGPDATGDDVDDTDDEDGLQTILVRQGTTTASAVVTAINPLASPVTLAGWIDFNASGSFDAGERAEIAVPANTTAATPFTLIWSGLPPIPLATGAVTFARFRIGATVGELAAPDGTATSGEVEDYQVTVDAQANLRVTKTSTPNPYIPGAPLTYTVVYTNDGPSPVVGAQVQDEVPAALTNVTWTCAASGGTCPAPSGTGGFDASINIGAGGTVTFTLTGDVPTGLQGVLLNTATILPPPGVTDPNPNNNSAVESNPTIAIPMGPADLQITQLFPGVAQPNGLLTFTLVTRNLGSNVALNPYITGMIPPGTTFVSVGTSAGGTCQLPDDPAAPDPATGYPIGGAAAAPLKCTWPGLMKPGESHTMTFTVRVAPGTPTGQILWSCWWTWSETEDPYHANNVVDAYLFVNDGTSPVGDLSVQAAAMSLGAIGADGVTHDGTIGNELAVPVGGTVKMRFSSTNAGPVATRGQYALILDEVAIGVVDVTLPQGWVSPSGPSSAVWDTGVIQPGQTVNLDLTVRVNTTGAIKLFAQRITGSPGDPNASNEHAEIVLDGYGPTTAGRWVAVGDVDGAGKGEIVTGTGEGETPQVRVYTGTGADTGVRFFAYERPFLGGVRIASCDVNGDGVDELITAPGPGRAPTIRVLSLLGGVVTELTAFDAFEASFTGGASIACADLDADGSAELVIGAGPGRAPEVQVYSVGLSSLTVRATFLAYEAGFLGGVRVAAGVYPGRPGWLEPFAIATTPGIGRAAELRLWTPTGGPVAQVVVSSATKGVLPTLGDVNGDGQLDLLLAPDDGRPELVRIFNVDSGELLGDVPGNLPGFPVGIRTAVGALEGGPGQPEIVIGNGPGGHPRVRVIYWPPAGPVQRLEILPLEIP
jgi:uncharacterized repeat protein (TIGR01451 family)